MKFENFLVSGACMSDIYKDYRHPVIQDNNNIEIKTRDGIGVNK